MQIVFFGTPYYVLPILDLLHKSFKEYGVSPIQAVVTQSPKPTGRKQTVEYSPVDKWAHDKKIPIYFDSNQLINDGISADIGILASYGAFIPEAVIKHFPKGILVIHPSMLPEFRGSSPVPAMILTGSTNVGCSIFKMDNQWDHGPIVTQFKDDITSEDNTQTLRDRLFERSAEVLVQALPAYLTGKIKLRKQEDTKASFARMLNKNDSYIPLDYLKNAINKNSESPSKQMVIDFIKTGSKNYTLQPTALNLHNFIRAMSPWPGAWTQVKIENEPKRLKILKARINALDLIIEEVQLEGKNSVSWNQFKVGYPKINL